MHNVKKYQKYMKTQIYTLDVKHTLQSYYTRAKGSFTRRLGCRWRRRHPVGDASWWSSTCIPPTASSVGLGCLWSSSIGSAVASFLWRKSLVVGRRWLLCRGVVSADRMVSLLCPLVEFVVVSFGVVVGPYRSSVDAPCFDAHLMWCHLWQQSQVTALALL